jgi:hypothetical protein
LEKVLSERGPAAYARFKGRLRLSSANAFGAHMLDPPFPFFEWLYYPEPGSYRGPAIEVHNARSAQASFVAPDVNGPRTIHVLLMVTDCGSPPLTRYRRLVITVAAEPARGP